MIEKQWIIYSSRFSGWETGLPMLMEHVFLFQYEIYWKKHDFLKNALKKRFSRQKSLTHCVVLYTTIWWLATHQPSHPKNTPSLEYKVVEQPPTWPILCHQYTTRAVCLTNCRFNLPSPNLPSSGLVEFYVRQMVCVCFYSLCKIVHYTCNVEYTTRCACLASRLAPTFAGP